MKSKKIIGLTGSIATGKSTVARILMENGYEVIDADKVAHQLMQKNQANYNDLVEYFGNEILDDEYEIDRKKLSSIVFSNPDELKMLNNLTHGNIFNRIEEMINQSQSELIFVELPILVELLIEERLALKLDEIWLVYLDREKQLIRLMERNGYSYEDALDRINSQLSVDEKKKFADFIIYNDKDVEYLEKQIKERLDIER